MVREFEDKNYWALILGGSSGLGYASALKLAAHGMNICIIHRNRRSELEAIEKSFDQLRSHGVQVLTFNEDAFKQDNRDRIIAQLEKNFSPKAKVRLLLHSVAKGNLKPMISTDVPSLENDDFRLTIDAMALSLFDWTKAIHQASLFADDARVLSFTSEGNTKAWKQYAAVSAAKASLEAISRNIALEFASYGIRANCIQAGVTDTASLRAIPGSDRIKEYAIFRNPMQRLTTPEDVANVVYLLTKDEAAWINGSIIPVDGGEHIQ